MLLLSKFNFNMEQRDGLVCGYLDETVMSEPGKKMQREMWREIRMIVRDRGYY